MLVTKQYEDGHSEQMPLSAAINDLMPLLLNRLQQAIDNNDALATHTYAKTLTVLDRAYEAARFSEPRKTS